MGGEGEREREGERKGERDFLLRIWTVFSLLSLTLELFLLNLDILYIYSISSPYYPRLFNLYHELSAYINHAFGDEIEFKFAFLDCTIPAG